MTTFDPTLAAIQNAVDGAVADYHERVFREQCARDPELARICRRPVVVEREYEADAEAYFLEQQCPSDAAFR